MIPGFKKYFEGINQFYKKFKQYWYHDLNDYSKIKRKDLQQLEVPIHESIKGDTLNIYDVASFDANHIIIIDKPGHIISNKLLKLTGISANKEKISVIEYDDDETIDYMKICRTNGSNYQETLKLIFHIKSYETSLPFPF